MKNIFPLLCILLCLSISSCTLTTEKERMPTFPGKDFRVYLKENIKYPIIEKEAGKQGTVYISFIVEKDGSISNVHPVREVRGAPGLTKEAMRVIKGMPNWNPGKTIAGFPARIELKQPIRFVLQ